MFVLGACAEDVVVGRYLTAEDAGATDAGTSDAGAADAGSFDAGAPDAGVMDSGSADGGLGDAGAFDAGAFDAGDVDAGGSDAGALDAGADDGGPKDSGIADAGSLDAGIADLTLDPALPTVLEPDGGPLEFLIRFRNIGALPTIGRTELVPPPGMSVLPIAGCLEDGGTTFCPLGALAAGASTTLRVPFAFTAGPRWFDLSVSVLANSPEESLANNKVLLHAVLTPSSTNALAVTTGAPTLTTACFGTNITRYAQCVPGSRLSSMLVFFADGGLTEADGGPPGFWAQGPGQRNLAFRFGFLGGMSLNSFSGATDGGTCFEGVVDNNMGVPNSGAFQLCF